MFRNYQYPEIVQYIDKQLKKKVPLTDRSELYFYQGVAYYVLGQFEHAIEIFFKIPFANQNRKRRTDILYFYLLSLFFSGQHETFLHYFEKHRLLIRKTQWRQDENGIQCLSFSAGEH